MPDNGYGPAPHTGGHPGDSDNLHGFPATFYSPGDSQPHGVKYPQSEQFRASQQYPAGFGPPGTHQQPAPFQQPNGSLPPMNGVGGSYGYPIQSQYGAAFGFDPVTGLPYSDKTRIVAGLLQLFLGGVGAGRWYVGTTVIAAVQLGLWIVGLLTSWLLIGIPILIGVGIWTFIDAILMFTGSVRDGQGRVLR